MSSPMNSGVQYGYAEHSSFQKRGSELAERIIGEEIGKNLDVRQLLSSSAHFAIADFGCSVGSNSFGPMDSIIKAVDLKSQASSIATKNIEYQVFFNDQFTNDFNTLFNSMPLHRQYHAAAVPGSFHDRVFPKAFLHFMYSSYALHCLSRVPKEVVDEGSVAWNKGSIHYGSKEVEAAYLAQYMEDAKSFFTARAEELQPGGLLALVIPSVHDGIDTSKCTMNAVFHLLGSTLMDMAKMGLVDEAKINSFNIPTYFASPKQVDMAIQENKNFTILRMERQVNHIIEPKAHHSRWEIQKVASMVRSAYENILAKCFGNDVMDELFDQLVDKLIEAKVFEDEDYLPPINLVLILQRKRKDLP